MKHLLNDMSQEESNSIRKQHLGGKKLDIENFNEMVEKRLGDVPTLLNEMDGEFEIPQPSDKGNKMDRLTSNILSDISRELYRHEGSVLDYEKINDLMMFIERMLMKKM